MAAITLAPLLIIMAQGPAGTVSATIYAVGVILLFVVSSTYHRIFIHTRFSKLARRLDHSMIFVFIAATYTPVAMMALSGTQRWIVMSVVWGGAVAGIVIRMLWLTAPRFFTVAPYLLVGWCIVPFLGDVFRGLGTPGFVLLAVGGGIYSVAALIYAGERPDISPKWFGYHELFHLLVVAAVAVHYVAVAFFALPLAA